MLYTIYRKRGKVMQEMEMRLFESTNKDVIKYVFTKADMVAETVLYKYGDYYKRTVICCSTMSGCPVGCTFCGTGKKFIRNLTSVEIVDQIKRVLYDRGIEDVNSKAERFQIMFMSMGEPMLNWEEVEKAIRILNVMYPNADLLLSTVGIRDKAAAQGIAEISKEISKVGLQFSVHKSTDEARTELIPFKNKFSLKDIRDYGLLWWAQTGRKVYLNYCVTEDNNKQEDFERLTTLFSPTAFNFTFSVVSNADEQDKDRRLSELEEVQDFANKFVAAGYNTRVFNPAGQDDIGGGCGQLWFVQKWMKEHGR